MGFTFFGTVFLLGIDSAFALVEGELMGLLNRLIDQEVT